MQSLPCLTLTDARALMDACQREAAAKHWPVTIVIVDAAGIPILLERLDGAPMGSPEIALGKARTAALARTPTKTLEEMVKERPAVATFPGRVPVQGGLPLMHLGHCVGAIGVSGVKSFEDEQVAQAGVAALAAPA